MDYTTLGYVLAALFIGAALIYYFVIRVTMDPRVKELAEFAYKCAAEINGHKAKGSAPPVQLKGAPWKSGSGTIIGNYRWRHLFLFAGPVVWDRILVVADFRYIFSNLVHEMTHAVRRRNGLKSSEAIAEAAEAVANKLYGSPELTEMLKRFDES